MFRNRRKYKEFASVNNTQIKVFYVYALKDPLVSGKNIFYIGKGTKIRLEQQIHQTSGANKDVKKRIESIREAGHEVEVTILVSKLTESEALMLEAELIAAYGVRSQGGQLLNKIIPNPNIKKYNTINMSEGIYENAQNGIQLIERSICSLLKVNPNGLTNAEIAKALNLESSFKGELKNYLTHSILGNLMAKNQVVQTVVQNGNSKIKRFYLV